MADSSEEEDGGPSLNLTGFLFGNINEKGELEDSDILDEESKKHLDQLNTLGGLGNLCRDIASESDDTDVTQSVIRDNRNSGWIQKDASATDYSDINELAEEDDKDRFYQHAVTFAANINKDKTSEDDDYNADDEETSRKGAGFSLPTVVPAASTLSKQEEDRLAMPPPPPPLVATDGSPSSGPVSSVTADDSRQVQSQAPGTSAADDPSKETNLPRTSDGRTVTELFPEFKPGRVLRFSRLFGPSKASSLPQLWRNAKKRKKKKKKLVEEEQRSVLLTPPKSPPLPRPEDCMSDDEDKLMAPMEPLTRDKGEGGKDRQSDTSQDQATKNLCEWRYGPAVLWYELLGVHDDGSNLDYGFRLKQEGEELKEIPSPTDDLPPDECFNMVAQVNWEDNIIWSPDQVKVDLQAQARAGWIPTGTTRTAQAYATLQQQLLQQLGAKHPGLEAVLKKTGSAIEANAKTLSVEARPGPGGNSVPDGGKPSTWYSIFPVENEELVYGKWEDKIIWDAQAMTSLPTPPVMLLDPNDENIILGIPEDRNPNKANSVPAQVAKKESKNKSKLILGKNNKNDDENEENTRVEPQKDPYNLSNDEYYSAKHNNVESSLEAAMGSNLVQHSTPALALQRPYFPTYMSPQDLRLFHHVPLKRPSYGPLAKPGRHVVYGLLKHIKKKAREREKERLASGGGEMFFMRTPADLTGMDGDLVLAEYCEEYPPLIMAVGMNTRIRNYYKRKPGSKEDSAPNLPYGEDVPVHQLSPFLGQLSPGEHISAFENNLFRAPIYHHQMPEVDFLVIKAPNGFYIRNINSIFLVGQECPKFEVPGPNSKKANIHSRDFLQVFIYRLFWKSQDTPRRIKMEDIKRAFPNHSESSIRKRLKLCADFKRTGVQRDTFWKQEEFSLSGVDCNWWVLKSDFRLPTEEEMRAMVSPEQCCAYYSMLAAEQRLKDAGYGEKSLFSPEDDNEDSENKVDDEVRCAPWNTTRAFISAMRGKCQLAVTGAADPTGCGEGFSYVRVPNKPMATKQDESSTNSPQIRKQKTVTGTDADLRRLSLKQARQVLRNFGVSEEEIKKLSRWEVIDVVRTMSTEAAKSGEEGMSKFARGSRFTIAEHQERYKEECQRIFELQNRVLSSTEVLSTDEESSSDEGSSDIDELGKNLESMLANKKTGVQLTHEQEEEERRELQRLLSEDKPLKESNGNGKSSSSSQKDGGKKMEDDDSNSVMSCGSSMAGRRLLIQRTFRTQEGREYARTEVVKNQAVIDAYLRVVNKDKNVRAHFASVDEVHKEEIRREKRRIQEQLRRIKRNQEKEKLQPVKKKKEKPPSNVRLKCGACGAIGHMRTNKNCPLYQEANPGSVTVAMTDEQVAEEELNMPQDDLVKVEGTKITLGKAFLESTQELKRKALVLRFPKESVRKKRRSGVLHCDYLKRPHKSINRRRANPEVALQLIFENIINKMKEVEDSWVFHQPVSAKNVPDYYKIVKNGMDLQTMRENLRTAKYQTREEFLEHCSLIVSNSVLYNGAKNTYTETAQKMLDMCNKMLNEKEEEIISLEKDINPLLSDDSQVAFSWVLENVVANMRAMPESWPFHKPVSSKMVRDYYDVVKQPMDLDTLRQQVQDHYYRMREEFLDHVRLLHSNSALYNGPEHEFTATAEKIVKFAEDALKENEEYVAKLESEIAADDSSSYIAESQPPSVMSMGGLESTENSMDGFPDTSRDEESMDRDSFMDMDDVTRDGFSDVHDSRAISTPVPGYKGRSAADDEDELVDVEGSCDEDSMLRKLIPRDDESTRQSALQGESQGAQSEENFESILLQDLQHSDSESESDEDDFPFGDGDEEEEEEDLEDEMEDVPEASGEREEEGGGEQDHDSFQFSPGLDMDDTAGALSDDEL